MAVANLCIKKEWEEWKEREMEKKRRRRWRERVSHWTSVEIKGEEEEEEEKGGESNKENSDCEEDEVTKDEEEEQDEEEAEDVEMLEAGETDEDENEVRRGVNEMKSGAVEDKEVNVLEWEVEENEKVIEDQERKIKKAEELEEEEETEAERQDNFFNQDQKSQMQDVQDNQVGENDLNREAKSREMDTEEEKEVTGAEVEKKETGGEHVLEREAKSKEMGTKDKKEATQAKGEVEVISGEHESERDVVSEEIGAEEEKEETEAGVEREEREEELESEREVESEEICAEEEKEETEPEVEREEREEELESEREVESKEICAEEEKEETEAEVEKEEREGKHESEREVESNEICVEEEKEETEAEVEKEEREGEHESEREVESEKICVEEEKEVTGAEVETEEREGERESQAEVKVTEGVVADEEAKEVEEENEEGLEERDDELQRGFQLCDDLDEEEDREDERVQHFGEEDDEAGEHQEQETTGRYRDREQIRCEDENAQQNQDSRSQGHKHNEAVNPLGSVEATNEDCDFLGSEDEEEDPNEHEDINTSITRTKTSDEKEEEEEESTVFTDGEETVCDSWTTQVEELQDEEEEESSDEEEADLSAEEDIDEDVEDVVKNYCKDDYLTDLFGTLTEFRDSFILTDLTLSTEDGKSFHVHSPVLAAISIFIWEKLAKNNMEDNRKDDRGDGGVQRWSVCLGPEVDHVGLGAIVEFAYTGNISRLNKDTVHQIKAAAHAIAAPRVLDLCSEEEKKALSPIAATQEKEEGTTAAEQMMMSLQSIQQLRVDRVGCDVILEANGGSLHVHRVILAVWSDYFRSMFTLGMRETHQACVTLPYLLASELEALINCSYCGALPLSWSCIFEITSTALQLQYQPALSLCLEFLQQELNPNFCLDVASFAEAYEMAELFDAAEDFVLLHFQNVACTSKFRDLPAKQLLRYLNSHSLCVPSELVVFKAVVAWILAKPKKRMKFAKKLMKTIHFPLMTFKDFKEVQSLNMWSEHSLAELFEAIFQDFCSNETSLQDRCRIYMPKESLVLIGGDQSFEEQGRRSISREVWFGNSLRNHTGIKKAMEWRRLGEMPDTAKYRHEVTVLKGQLYVFGGKSYYGVGDTLKSVSRYDPLQNTWESLAEMNESRCSFSVVVLDGKIYAIGGYSGTEYLETVEQYCAKTNTWRFTWPLDLPLGAHAAKVLQGHVFVSGGMCTDYQCLSSMIMYHPERGNVYLENMAYRRAHHCMESLGHCLYVAGGITMGERPTMVDQLDCEVYNPVANSWTAFTPLPVPHVGAGCAVLEGKFYVLGGYSQENYSDTKTVHRYDPATERWENMGKMPGPNNDIRATLLCLPPHLRT